CLTADARSPSVGNLGLMGVFTVMDGLRGTNIRLVWALVLPLALGACGGIPREGPLSAEIEQQSDINDYVVVDVDADIVHTLSEFEPVGLSTLSKNSGLKSPKSVVGVGDVLAVSVFEAASGGLFSGENGNRAEFPSVAVDRTGRISLPYAGYMKVAGRTSRQV